MEVDYLTLVNKQNLISEEKLPKKLVFAGYNEENPEGEEIMLDPKVAEQLNKMLEEANKHFTSRIIPDSGYRTLQRQQEILDFYLRKDQRGDDAYKSVALPGTSEHHTGLAVDVAIITNGIYNDNFDGEEPELIWLKDHCHEYGFILRYPRDKEEITGYIFEPWHFRYVGDVANNIMSNNLALEEYLNI